MEKLTEWARRLLMLVRRGQFEKDLEEEMRLHRELREREHVEAGMSPEEAHDAALHRFGNLARTRERSREMWGWGWLETTIQDVRYGVRQLHRKPSFTALAVLTLALGIGANTAMFSIVDAVLLRPLPYKNADRLTVIWQSDARHRDTGAIFDTYREFEEWQRNSQSFEKLAALTWANNSDSLGPLLWGGERQEVVAIPVTVDFFPLLGVQAAQGRTFVPADLSNPCTVVLAHAFWWFRLGATPGILGRSLTIGEKACTVVGVTPPDFSFYSKRTELWTLITPESDYAKHPWHANVGVFGLLKPGISRAGAEAELTAIQNRIIHEKPDVASLQMQPVVLDLQREFTWLTGRNLRASLMVLFAAVVFVLLIACVNVANLLLCRASERQHELGIRAALGSGRARLMRQLLTEALLFSTCGAAPGLLIAYTAVRYLRTASPVDLPPGNPVSVNGAVLVFTATLAVSSGLLFGLVPARKVSRVDLNEVLKESARGTSGGALSYGAGRVLVIAEVALSFVLLAGAGLLIESLDRFTTAPLGFQPDRVLTASLRLPLRAYSKPEQRIRFYESLKSGLGSLHGVDEIALSPYFGSGWKELSVEGRSAPAGPAGLDVNEQSVSEAYFRVLRIPLLRGRQFDTRDRERSLPVAIINASLAKKYFPNEDPLGSAIKLGKREDQKPWLTIVGVVGDVKSTTVFKEMGYVEEPCVYRPLQQDPVRTRLDLHSHRQPAGCSCSGAAPLALQSRSQPGSASAANDERMACAIPIATPTSGTSARNVCEPRFAACRDWHLRGALAVGHTDDSRNRHSRGFGGAPA